jgi:dipeptidyl aminopeptidase/acylaminoacyl peptidase
MDAASPQHPLAVVAVHTGSGDIEVYRQSFEVSVDGGYISVPEAIEYPTENGLRAHGFYYPPTNKDVVAPDGERPPLLVRSHGGPTAAASSVLNLDVQYWTSRGIGILDVNYGGSTGYGREYRQRLDGQWGVVDVDDCVNAARYLVARGDVDGARLLIDGGSAGGYTTLCALTFRDAFAAGASHYGIGDLTIFAHETHKFESRYLQRLVGPLPERADLYHDRSPINYVDRLSCPVILFQGLEDEIVPPNQAELMFAALRHKGLPCAYLAFPGEQHGFRRAENIRRALEAELYFFSRVFGFELADAIEPVAIENM